MNARENTEGIRKLMTMGAGARKLALTAHVASSVGWLGAVAVFLALAVAGLTDQNARVASAAYPAMELTTWFVILPLAVSSLLTGLLVSLGTPWGLFRHYWVLVKFLITIVATILLLAHTQPIGVLAAAASEGALSGADVRRLQIQIAGDAGVALLALLANVALSVFKPWGVTPYGLRWRLERHSVPAASLPSRRETGVEVSPGSSRTPRWVYVAGIPAIGLALLFLAAHLREAR